MVVARYNVPCRAPLWARGGQAQTLLGYLLSTGSEPIAEERPGVRRYDVDHGDGDVGVTFELDPLATEASLSGTVVHLFHGLTGSSDSNYVRLSASVLRAAGARVIAFNHRGQGPGAGLARGLYHSGSDLDLLSSIAAARARWPGVPHIGVGFSLSANTLLLGAARRQEQPGLPDAILSVNPPAHLSRAVHRMERGFNRIYDKNFVRGMRESLEVRRARGWLEGDVHIPAGSSVRQADDLVTAPAAGYSSAEEYYADCSSSPRWGSIQLPAVILSAADDPFIGAEDLLEPALGPRMLVHMEATGGHLGYLARGAPEPPGGSPRRWLAGALLHYVTELRRELS